MPIALGETAEEFPLTGAVVDPSPLAELAVDALREFLTKHGYDTAAKHVRLSKVPYRPIPR